MADIRTGQEHDDGGQLHPARKVALGVNTALGRIEVIALFPLLVLAATWFGFDDLAMVTAGGLAGLLAIGTLWGRAYPTSAMADNTPLPSGRQGLVSMMDRIAGTDGRDTACFLLQIDDWPATADLWGHDLSEDIISRVQERLFTALRTRDQLMRLGDAKFGIVLDGLPSARLGLRDTIATRLSDAVAEPIALRGVIVRLSVSIGHTALIRRGADSAETTFKAAEAALSDAILHAPGATRAFAPGMGRSRSVQTALSAEVEGALHDGAITAWFQPQICARTRVLTGMETLARWDHPKKGLLSPKEFFSAVEASGHMPLLGRTLMHQALKALDDWDKAEANVPGISINFSPQELRDLNLPQALHEEVARYGLAPDRITIEINETVASQTDDDSILATLSALHDAGHRMDLDKFGLGSVSLPALQRFNVTRVKIDQSFVLGIDAEEAKQRTVAAIVAMAKALGIQCLAKGVETPQEMEALSVLGCDHLQGFRVARPMSGDRVADWARAHSAQGKTIRLNDRRNA